MRRALSLLAVHVLAITLLAGCGGRNAQVVTPEKGDEPGLTQGQLIEALPALSVLDGGTARAASATINMDLSFTNFTGNVTVAPGSVEMVSGAAEIAAAWWGMTPNYGGQQVPYIAPYDITVTASGDEYYVLLADYSSGVWELLPDTYTGTNTFDVSLTANAANAAGTFWFAIITWGGSQITITDIALEYPDPPLAGKPVDYFQYIEMGDGTNLATNVYLPYAASNPFEPNPPYPVILIRTPYDKADFLNLELDMGAPIGKLDIATALTTAKVIVAVQYFRGRLNDTGAWPDSFGTETLFREHAGPDNTDAVDTIDWLEGRQFYNGDMVLAGPSALGLWIYQAATQLGDRIQGIYPMISSGDVGDWAAQRNGCFKYSNVVGWLTGNGFPPALIADVQANYGNAAYWDAVNFDAQASGTDCPGYHEASWWDVDIESTIASWDALNSSGGPAAAGNQWLVIGPGDHQNFRLASDPVVPLVIGDLTFPNGDDIHDPGTIPMSWDGIPWMLDRIGRSIVPFNTPSQHVYAYWIGNEGSTTEPHNTWYEFADWPPAYSELTYYLAAGDPIGEMPPAPPATEETMAWWCEPWVPVDTIGGANLPGGPVLAGPYDQSAAESRPDVMQHISTPLTGDISIGGPIRVVLHVSTDAVDTDIMVKLIDHYPDTGPSLLVADSAVRLSHYLEVNGLGTVSPGTVYEVELEIGQRGYVFSSGHSIGIDIQSTNFPRFAVNPGNGDPFFEPGPPSNGQLQNNTLYMSETRPSRLILPEFDPSA